ncbi:RCCD1 (predicted) [Pycnogonum litorale]
MESPSDDNGRHALAAVEFDFPVDVVEDVRCGLEHFLILTETGRIYGYGLNSRGQLGSGCAVDVTCSATPSLIEALHGIKVTSIDCGAWHSVALTEFGDVYTWGWNESGQLGLVNDDAEAERPTEDNRILIVSTPTLVSSIPDDVNIVKMSCGTRHTVALSEDGFLWAWGWNKYGQLCTGDEDNCTVPIKVETFGHRIRDLRASRWLTFIQI